MFFALASASLRGMEPPKRPAQQNASNGDQAQKRLKAELIDEQKEYFLAQVRGAFYSNFSQPMKALSKSFPKN